MFFSYEPSLVNDNCNRLYFYFFFHQNDRESKATMQVTERLTGIDGALVHKSATLHQRMNRFREERRNRQCMAISVICIAALPQIIEETSIDLLDNIIIRGDEFYAECKEAFNVRHSFLAVDEILPRFRLFHNIVDIEVAECGLGTFNENDIAMNLIPYLESCRTLALNLKNVGFLFIGHGKAVSFKISRSTTGSFFLFNSHCVGLDNCTVVSSSSGLARLFRCTSAQALGTLLVRNEVRDGGYWQIYSVAIS